MNLLIFQRMFATAVLVALPLAAMAQSMAFYEGKVSTTEPRADEAANIEPAAGPKCPEIAKNPCGYGRAALYSTDEQGCRKLMRCGGMTPRLAPEHFN